MERVEEKEKKKENKEKGGRLVVKGRGERQTGELKKKSPTIKKKKKRKKRKGKSREESVDTPLAKDESGIRDRKSLGQLLGPPSFVYN